MDTLWQFLIENPLIELWLITLVLVFFWYAAKVLRQPVLIWYILWWLFMGPQVFNVIHHYENIEFYAHFGVSLLLFMVGLGLNPGIIKEVGKVATVAWVWQVIFTSVVWYWISLALWFSVIVSLFIAIALTFSSTIVIVKLISDRWDAGTTYGKIAFGILIVQDIIAMLILLWISAFSMQGEWQALTSLLWIIGLKVTWLVVLAWVFWRYILPKILSALAKQKELLLLFIITRAILFGWLRYYAWFSMEIGALLAWVTLASSRYRFHIFSELRPFRDFFLALFFVYLWGQIIFDNVASLIIPIILFSLFVLIWNPIIVVSLMMKLWYNRKDSFMTWLTVAQISEFSFIVIWLALSSWIIEDPNILALVTIIGLITMMWSSYMFANAEKIFAYSSPYLKKIEHTYAHDNVSHETDAYQMIIVWYGRLWTYIASKLREHQISFCIVERDIQKMKLAEEAWFTTIYWDVEDNDTLLWLISSSTELVYATVDNHDTSIHVIESLKEVHDHLKVIVIAKYIDEAENLYNTWADYVVFPHLSWAHESRAILEKHVREPEQFLISKIQNIEALQIHKTHIFER